MNQAFILDMKRYGWHLNKYTHRFEMWVFDEMVREMSVELALDANHRGELKKLLLSAKEYAVITWAETHFFNLIK